MQKSDFSFFVKNAEISILRFQLPIVSGHCVSVVKCQGKSEKMVSGDLNKPPTGGDDERSNYVWMSRVKSLNGLVILSKWDPDILLNSRPSAELLTEMERLRKLSHECVSSYADDIYIHL